MGGHMLRALNPLAGQSFTISPTLTNCDAIPKEAFACGSIGLPASTTITTLTVYTSHDGTNWGKVQDRDGQDVTITVTAVVGEPVFPELPDISLKYSRIKLKSQTGASEEEATVVLTS
jgi:hypothetical protein